MKWGAKQQILKLTSPRRRTFRPATSGEFFALCARERAGEFRVTKLSRGKGNADWVFEVIEERKRL